MASTNLIDYDGNRHNNLTTIRIIFALSVLYGHSYAIQNSSQLIDPLTIFFKGSTWIGEIAVNGFFAISGYLVIASFIKRGLKDYVISRILRIYPALLVCVFITIFILGPAMTKLNIWKYFSESQTYEYLMNGLAFFPKKWYLPGLFETNYNKAVNGSLWTLTVELRCYLLLAVVGFFGIFKDRFVANAFLLATFIFGIYFFSDIPFVGLNPNWSITSSYFLIGIFFYINRDKIILNGKLAIFALSIVLYSFGKIWYPYVFPFTFVYLIFYVAYATKYIDTDRKIGDISYGIYIYAFPIQQVIVVIFPNFSPYENSIVSSFLVVGIALLSWYLIEKPMLALKKKIIGPNKSRYELNAPPVYAQYYDGGKMLPSCD